MRERMHIAVRGAVQGVGFRPFVYRLAGEHRLAGWVLNDGEGVFIEAEGTPEALRAFLLRLESDRPPRSSIQSLEYAILDPAGYDRFEIRPSGEGGPLTATILPDAATCPDCLREILDPSDRRYLYPFTNCTNCGPRFSIIESLPYDRRNTTMKGFTMCPACRAEYEDPSDRRFHAQPNACPGCGPRLELWDAGGAVVAARHDALLGAATAVRAGRIAAVKGLGGFQLLADARDDEAVRRLRERKRREEKPLAVMFPSIASVEESCFVSDLERRLLRSAESPIVLLKKRGASPAAPPVAVWDHAPAVHTIAGSVAPGNPNLGVMLPYTPLHHLLLRELLFPVVATSGNLCDEPICIDERDALRRLSGIADVYLVHDRPIRRHADDSIVRIVLDREYMLRRARGYAPLPVSFPADGAAGGDGTGADARGDRRPDDDEAILATGAHLKNTVALGFGGRAFVSQHIGDLETAEAFGAFRAVVADFTGLYRPATVVAHDLHPDYLSTKYAARLGLPSVAVQHHYAHVASCMAENRLGGEVLGVSWDGTGYGDDGTVWGGEFLLTTGEGFTRFASLRPFRLPGGEKAVREPRRSAVGALYELYGGALPDDPSLTFCTKQELDLFAKMIGRGFNAPVTTSAGRLFDAVASIAGLRQVSTFEGQAAMQLEFAAEAYQSPPNAGNGASRSYECGILPPGSGPGLTIVDWGPVIEAILADKRANVDTGLIALKFHQALADAILGVARTAGVKRVVLTGGCFQNVLLLTRTVSLLESAGFRPYWHQLVPPNDGGIALGQVHAAALMRRGNPRPDAAVAAPPVFDHSTSER